MKAALLTYCGNQLIPWVLTPFRITIFPFSFTRPVPFTFRRPFCCRGVAAAGGFVGVGVPVGLFDGTGVGVTVVLIAGSGVGVTDLPTVLMTVDFRLPFQTVPLMDLQFVFADAFRMKPISEEAPERITLL